MNGKIQIRLGDLFEGPADLIILPCSTVGGVTQFVWNKLKMFDIPHPPNNKPLGHLEIIPFKGAESIAQYVGFGFSVLGNASNYKAIEDIGEKVGKFTMQNESVKIISVPLLGAGAGGLQSEKVVETLKNGFLKSSAMDSKLVVHILHKKVFDRVVSAFSEDCQNTSKVGQNENNRIEPLRVFLSYTSTDDLHQKWVENLGTFLRRNGINARLDVWHLRTGMDLPQFMTNELMLADRVLIISNEKYAAKANGRHGGVGWESMIIQGDMSKRPPDSTKYLAIVKCEEINDGLPDYLRSKYVVHWKNDSNEIQLQQKILKELLFTPKEPAIGIAPVFV